MGKASSPVVLNILLSGFLISLFCFFVFGMGGNASAEFAAPVVMGAESIMNQKVHGTCDRPVQSNLRYNCNIATADKICCFNRHYAEHAGYWSETSWIKEIQGKGKQEYFDSVTGKLLFTAPVDRTEEDFFNESKRHGWPSFRDQEVNWENVRILPGGECVSVDGTHLGHLIPDSAGRNRYCINLVCVAGSPESKL